MPRCVPGPMLINNVRVINNTFIGAADGNRDVHPSPQATNITIAGNLPYTPKVKFTGLTQNSQVDPAV